MSFIRWRRWSWGLDARTLRRLSRSSLKSPIIPKRCKCKLTNHRCTMMPMRLVCFAHISWFIKAIVANKKQIPPLPPKQWRHPIPPKTSWGDLSNIFSFPPRKRFLSLHHPPPKRKKLFFNCTSNNNNYIKCDSLELEKQNKVMLESGFGHPEKHNLPVPHLTVPHMSPDTGTFRATQLQDLPKGSRLEIRWWLECCLSGCISLRRYHFWWLAFCLLIHQPFLVGFFDHSFSFHQPIFKFINPCVCLVSLTRSSPGRADVGKSKVFNEAKKSI